LVAGNNVALVNGSVGYFPDINSGGEGYQQGRVIWGGTATIAENVGYSKEKSGQGNPIDFASEQKYLTKMSSYWGNLSTEGNTVEYYYNGSQLFSMELNGENNDLNIFSIQASEFSKTKSFYFDVPISSTVLVNVLGKDVKLMDFGFFYITDDGTKIEGNKHNPGFPYSNILFNFLDAKTIEMSMIEINGSILAPYADILFSNGHIDGNLIAYSLRGTGESHNLITSNDQSYNVLFNGELPTSIPEPATMFLIGSGLAGIAAFRRRMES
jgi:choice-of-anchor A domain-containing protein